MEYEEETILSIKKDVEGCLTVVVETPNGESTGWRPSEELEKAIEKELKEYSTITKGMDAVQQELTQKVVWAYKTFKEAQEETKAMEVP